MSRPRREQLEGVQTDNTLAGDGTDANPLRVVSGSALNKLDDSFANYKEQLGLPSNPPSGETIHYTHSYLIGAEKITEHRIRNSEGEDIIVKSTKVAI